ncbi:MAG TPA: hypothetical protein VG711_00675 [Phycisphaerales bacterium]|nr:hypothetical protein [Phycisphaerales bacterium]
MKGKLGKSRIRKGKYADGGAENAQVLEQAMNCGFWHRVCLRLPEVAGGKYPITRIEMHETRIRHTLQGYRGAGMSKTCIGEAFIAGSSRDHGAQWRMCSTKMTLMPC